MKKLFTIITALALTLGASAQVIPAVAQDFNRPDCHGAMRHLFADLDSGNLVVLEFFMDSCTFCVDAAHPLEKMEHDLRANNGVTFIGYALPYTDTYSKTKIADWVTRNSLRSIPMDSGEQMVDYYGGFGMPTVVVLGGAQHRVITSVIPFLPRDTNATAAKIRSFLNGTLAVEPVEPAISSLSVFPNPASQTLHIEVNAVRTSCMQISIVNIMGQETIVMPDEKGNEGKWKQSIDISRLPAGNYMLRLDADGQTTSQHFTVVR